MYKRIYFLFIVFLLFSLIACNTKKEVTNTKTKTNINIITETEKSETDEKVLIEDIDVNYEEIMFVGDKQELDIMIFPEEASNKEYELVLSDSSLATIDSNNTLEAKNSGVLTVTIKAIDGSGVSKTINIEIKEIKENKKMSFFVEPDYYYDTSLYREKLMADLGSYQFTPSLTFSDIDKANDCNFIKVSPKEIEDYYDIKLFMMASSISIICADPGYFNNLFIYYFGHFYSLEIGIYGRYGIGAYSFAISGNNKDFQLYMIFSNRIEYHFYLEKFDSETKSIVGTNNLNAYFQFLNNNPNYLVRDSPNVFIPLLGIKNNTIGIFFSKEQFWVPNFHDMRYKDVHRIHVEYSKEIDYDKEIVGYDESNFFDKELYYNDDYEELEKILTPFDTSVPPVLDDSFKLESSIDTTGVTKISFVVEPDYEFDTSSYKEILLNQLGEETFTKNGTITLNEIDEKYNIPLIKISPKDIEELFDIKIFLYTSCGYIEMSSSNGIIYNYPYLYYNDQFYPLEFNMRAYRYGVGPYSFAISGDKSSFKLYTLISNFNYYLYTMLTSFDSNTKELKEFNYLEIFNDYYNRKIERTDAGQEYPSSNYIPLLAVKNNVIGIYYSKELVDMQNMCITNEYVGKIRTDYCLEADLEKGINFDEGNFFEINPFELYKYFLINNDIEPFI